MVPLLPVAIQKCVLDLHGDLLPRSHNFHKHLCITFRALCLRETLIEKEHSVLCESKRQCYRILDQKRVSQSCLYDQTFLKFG